jgi:hypothetical protein
MASDLTVAGFAKNAGSENAISKQVISKHSDTVASRVLGECGCVLWVTRSASLEIPR